MRKYTQGDTFKTNNYGDVVLLESVGKRVWKVRFVNSGFEREVSIDNLIAGKCRDYSVDNVLKSKTEYPYILMSSNGSGDFIVVEKTGKTCIIQFVDTGYTKECLWDNVKLGKISDPYAKSCYGIGYRGEFERVPYWKQAKQLWQNMMKRCYCQKDTRGYYGTVQVSSRWHCFANFLKDISELENFDLWLHGQTSDCATKYNLDKDFINPNNKIYCKEMCMFLTEALNKSLGGKNKVGNE